MSHYYSSKYKVDSMDGWLSVPVSTYITGFCLKMNKEKWFRSYVQKL